MRLQITNELPEHAMFAFVGIDWADAKHDICSQVASSEKRDCAVLSHRPESIEAWAHTWASWHRQSGTPTYELRLGGWHHRCWSNATRISRPTISRKPPAGSMR